MVAAAAAATTTIVVFTAMRKDGPIVLSSNKKFGRQERTRDEVILFPPAPHSACGLEDCPGLQAQSTHSTTPRHPS